MARLKSTELKGWQIAIMRKALTKDSDSRYQTARDMMIDLKSLRRELDIQSELKRSRN